ncbi:Hypothetical protein NTJ_13197 [Nesidiocoris tenuis]|uniref:Uncharacterized protein n=1 Tax=Nesidiocoris tenuis TaxID=355587 RepID=A0ABN7BB25_9HEMI|nr:Hypothetical protein NTJ_13197 [Nesidiocoris tenuis]
MKSVCLLFGFVGLCSAASLPSYIKPCKRGPKLNQCSIINGNQAIPLLVKGDSKLKIPSLDPIIVNELTIRENQARNIALNLTFKDLKIRHLSSGRLVDSKIDLEKRHVEWTIDVPRIAADSKYTVNGRILVLPIRGNGNCNFDLDKVKLVYTLDYKLNRVKGVDYAVITSTSAKFSSQNLKIHLENLFNGEKVLNDNMNAVLNDNWRELEAQMGPPIAQAIAIALKPIIDRVVSQVPFDTLFPK